MLTIEVDRPAVVSEGRANALPIWATGQVQVQVGAMVPPYRHE
jgi:hypothetical protein